MKYGLKIEGITHLYLINERKLTAPDPGIPSCPSSSGRNRIPGLSVSHYSAGSSVTTRSLRSS